MRIRHLVLFATALTFIGCASLQTYPGQKLNTEGMGMLTDADGDTGWDCDTDDQCQMMVKGAADFTYTANTFTAESGSTIAAQALTATTITASGAVSAASFGSIAQTVGIPFTSMRVFDDYDALLTNSAGDDDDLTFYQGTFGTNAATLESVDCGGLNDTTQKAYFQFVMPASYVAGSTAALVANAGMVTTVADQAATLDFQCYVPDYANEDGTVSTDLITTAAQSVNSTTFADKSFTLDDDASGYELDAGTVVECMVVALCDDDGNAGDAITIRVNRLDLSISE